MSAEGVAVRAIGTAACIYEAVALNSPGVPTISACLWKQPVERRALAGAAVAGWFFYHLFSIVQDELEELTQ